jgi:glycosyltransferase involved in cell wall biosynthesis
MPVATRKDLPALYRALLTGERKLVVWDGSLASAIREWQRQIPAEFLLNLRPELWQEGRYFGLPAVHPTALAKLKPEECVVANAYGYSSYQRRIESLLECLGGYWSVPPLHLHRMAHMAISAEERTAPSLAGRKDMVSFVNAGLQEFLRPPSALDRERALPSKDMLAFLASYKTKTYLQAALRQRREEGQAEAAPRAGHVLLTINTLNRGGAERQICNLAIGLQRLGWTPTVLAIYESLDTETYRATLEENGIACEVLLAQKEQEPRACAAALADLPPEVAMALWHLDDRNAFHGLYVYRAIRRLRPELVVSYLDMSNCASGIGGVLAGVPRLLLSGRSSASVMYVQDRLNKRMEGYYREIYRALLAQKDVFFSNNSFDGAKSYAAWLRVPEAGIKVVPNCVAEEFMKPVPAARRAILKKERGLKKGQPVVIGVFRLTAEKRPLDFIRVAAALRRKHPNLRVLLCGDGPMKKEVQSLIRRLKLEDTVRMLGICEDIPALMSLATLLLHTAEIEGSPNVVHEAQAIGLPVVCAENGGTRQILAPEWAPYRKKPGQIAALAEACDTLLRDPARRLKKAAAARKRTLHDASLEKLAQNTLHAAALKKRPPKSKEKTT